MRRATVLSLPPQLIFPDYILTLKGNYNMLLIIN
jgi:hypothetical protein